MHILQIVVYSIVLGMGLNFFNPTKAFAQSSWLHDLTFYSDISQEKLQQVLSDFEAKQARTKKFGEEYLGAEYYHFEIPKAKEIEFLQRLRALGEYSYDLRESFLSTSSNHVRFVLWHYRDSFPQKPHVFRVTKKASHSLRDYNGSFVNALDRYTLAGPVVFEENPDWTEDKIQVERLKKSEQNERLVKCDCDLVITWSPNPVVNEKTANVRSRNFTMPKSELKSFIASLVRGGTTKIWKSAVAGKKDLRVQFVNSVELKNNNLTIAKYLRSQRQSKPPGAATLSGPAKNNKTSRNVASSQPNSGATSIPVKVVKNASKRTGTKTLSAGSGSVNIDMSQYVLRSDYEALLAEVHKLTLEIQAMKEIVSRIRPTSLSRSPRKGGGAVQGGVLPNLGPVTTTTNTTTTTTTTVTTSLQSTTTTEVGNQNKNTSTTTTTIPSRSTTVKQESVNQSNLVQGTTKKPEEEEQESAASENDQSRMPAQALTPSSAVPEVKVNPSMQETPNLTPAPTVDPAEEAIEGTTIEYLD